MGEFFDKWEMLGLEMPLWRALIDMSGRKPRKFKNAQDCADTISVRSARANSKLMKKYEDEHAEGKRHPLASR